MIKILSAALLLAGVLIPLADASASPSWTEAYSSGSDNELSVDVAGLCNRTKVAQHGNRSALDVSVQGACNDTVVHSFGDDQRGSVTVRGIGSEIHFFAAPCPDGDRGHDTVLVGNSHRRVVVPQCR